MEHIFRALTLVIVGLVVVVAARLLAGLGLLDETLAAGIQLLLIPVKLVGALLGAAKNLDPAGGDPTPAVTRGGGPNPAVVGLLVAVGLALATARWWARPVLAMTRRRPRPVPTRPVTVPTPVVVPVPAPLPEGSARVASWDTAAAAARYRAWLSEVGR
jgi:hypothetical protein